LEIELVKKEIQTMVEEEEERVDGWIEINR